MSYKELETLVVNISPSKCVFFTFRSVFDYTLLKICISRGINKVLLEHGIIGKETLQFRSNLLKKTPTMTIKRQFYHLYKFGGFLIRNTNKKRELSEFLNFYKHGHFKLMQFDEFLIFSQRSFDYYSNVFGNIQSRCHIVGYPIFDTEQAKINSEKEICNKSGVLYIHQPFIYDGMVDINYEDEKKYLLDISSKLSDKYGKFVILLHPRSSIDDYKKLYAGTNIEVIQSPNNYKVFIDKKLLLGHYSTALLYGLYFTVPTVMIDYPSLPRNPLFENILPFVNNIDDLNLYDYEIDKDKVKYMLGDHNTYEYVAGKIFC